MQKLRHHNVSANDKWSKTGHESGKLDSEIELPRRMLHKRWVGRDQCAEREKKKIHQIYQNMRSRQLSQCITAHTVTAAEQRESTSSLAVSLKTMEPSSFTAGTESDGVVRKACVSLCRWLPCRGRRCVLGGWFSIRQAGGRACGQDRHTERGKTRDKGVQFTARDELSFSVCRKAFVIRLWAPLTDLQQSGRNENMLFRITVIGFNPPPPPPRAPRALCRHMMVYWSPIPTQQYCDISICQPAVEFGLVLPRPRPLWRTWLHLSRYRVDVPVTRSFSARPTNAAHSFSSNLNLLGRWWSPLPALFLKV